MASTREKRDNAGEKLKDIIDSLKPPKATKHKETETDIFCLASKYVWYSVLLFDKEYKDKQAEEKFEWGTYRQDLRDFQLVSKRENPTTRAMNEATKPSGKQPANNDRRRGPFLPDGREIGRSFNNNSCYRQYCRMIHNCAICMSSSHFAISVHGQSSATQAIDKAAKTRSASELGLNHAAKNLNCLRFEAWKTEILF
ncbi:unnamed protein product [Mytilus coruscus]|uniref:Uncharacterized protein n=1 Tax=Mytilus coruscus TaxID=42192 RepID=A0A6J8B755_MYTCO|nr:unnamed protein product [Mytilus coruscus]